jgi:hypothetical protein
MTARELRAIEQHRAAIFVAQLLPHHERARAIKAADRRFRARIAAAKRWDKRKGQ